MVLSPVPNSDLVPIRIANPVWAGDSFCFFRLRFTASGIQESTPGGFSRRRLALTAKIRILRCPKRRAIAGLAQLVEQLVYTEWVGGSNPSLRTIRFVLVALWKGDRSTQGMSRGHESVSAGVVQLSVEILLADHPGGLVERLSVLTIELLDGDAPGALGGLHGRRFDDAPPLKVVIGVVPIREGDMVLGLQATGTVMNHLEGDYRIGVWVPLLEEATAGQEKQGAEDEE